MKRFLVVVTKTVRNGEEITTNNIKTNDLLELLDTFRYEVNKSIWFEIFLIIKYIFSGRKWTNKEKHEFFKLLDPTQTGLLQLETVVDKLSLPIF